MDSYDALSGQIDHVSVRIDELTTQLPSAALNSTDQSQDPAGGERPLAVIPWLDQTPGVAPQAAQIIIAEIGLEIACFPT
ncbi:hypothetical protein [Nakamurella sp.]|uniref:hypothetical protein n=1 Tax=Nakamurella sp. TaxID=1869182 RepID=UPI003B3B2668